MQKIAAVTGGTGFLGRHVVAALLQAGWVVRVLMRHDLFAPPQAQHGVEPVPGDLDDAAALGRLVQDAAVVVHVAGLTKAPRPADFMAINRDGTARLAGIVRRQAPSARFILVSSQAAREPSLSAYAASKRAAEDAVVAELAGLDWIILRPCVIYGPGDREGIALSRLVRRRLIPVSAAPEPRIAMIHARDAATAIVAVCAGGPSRAVFELCDGCLDGHAWREIITLAAGLLGQTPRIVPVPDGLILGAGSLSDLWGRVIAQAPLFGRGKAREILHRDWRPDRTMQLPADLWQPTIDLRSGLTDTAAWWRTLDQAGEAPA
ncbi:NAD-dependent epimerase/dehydratase family protein [Lichenicola sp.]|uniref:NAD-dependent epimerase/dehydratase family protein n=1 Tax=Lichenicola sp. TaxID=2804529 RepID=UPI003B005217